jgi:putative FmdB family regulatory protein
MPTYDYRCDQCGTVFEARRSFSEDASSAPCPEDGTGAVRLFSPPLDVLVYGKEYRTPGRTPPAAPGPAGGGDHGRSHGPGGHSHGHSHGPGGHTH